MVAVVEGAMVTVVEGAMVMVVEAVMVAAVVVFVFQTFKYRFPSNTKYLPDFHSNYRQTDNSLKSGNIHKT